MAGERKTYTLRVFRYNPDTDQAPRYEVYEVPYEKGLTVLDALLRVKAEQDPTLSLRYSCRMGVCGSCGMFINGVPRLACQTQIAHLGTEVITVEPLPNYDVVRDVVPDLMPLLRKHETVKPYIIRDLGEEGVDPTREFHQTPQELQEYLEFSYCIRCGLCLAACPTVATDPEFLGPEPLMQAYRYSVDTRDMGFLERLEAVSGPHGCFRCHYAAACSEVCPKGADPALAIQLLKRQVSLTAFGFQPKKKVAQVVPQPPERRREGIPAPPPPTV